MYYVTLCIGMSLSPAPAHEYQGGATNKLVKFVEQTIPHGCQGSAFLGLRDAFANRPRLLGHRRNQASFAQSSYGATSCSGAQTQSYGYASGCQGSATLVESTATVTTTKTKVGAKTANPAGTTSATAVFRDDGPVARFMVKRQLHKALKEAETKQGLTDEQRTYAKRALSNESLFEAAVSHVHMDLTKKTNAQASANGLVAGKLGDGTILQKIFDNLPAIIAMIKELWSMFSYLPADMQKELYALTATLVGLVDLEPAVDWSNS